MRKPSCLRIVGDDEHEKPRHKALIYGSVYVSGMGCITNYLKFYETGYNYNEHHLYGINIIML